MPHAFLRLPRFLLHDIDYHSGLQEVCDTKKFAACQEGVNVILYECFLVGELCQNDKIDCPREGCAIKLHIRLRLGLRRVTSLGNL